MPFAQLMRHDADQVRRLPSAMPGPRDDGLQIVGKQAFGGIARAGRSRLVSHPCGRRRKGPPVVESQRTQGCCNVERDPLLNRPRVARVPGRGLDHPRDITADTDKTPSTVRDRLLAHDPKRAWYRVTLSLPVRTIAVLGKCAAHSHAAAF
jgi:hypothetical protein